VSAHAIPQAVFAAIVSIAADAIVTVDERHAIVLFNEGAEQIFGYVAAEAVGQSLDLLLPPELAQRHGEHIRRFGRSAVIARRMGAREEIVGRRKNGEIFPAEASISRVDVDGTRYYTAVLRDVTERDALLKRERSLRVAAEEAEADNARLYTVAQQAIRARDEILAVVSHDLRNPLSAITMCAGALREPEPPRAESVRELGETIARATEWMDRIIRDLVDVASIEAGRLSLRRERTTVGAIVEQAVLLLEPLCEERQLSLGREIAPDLPIVAADAQRIVQVLSNLVGNACRFTPPGGRVTVRAMRDDGGVRMSVEDTGAGIPAEDQPRVFDRYWHADRGTRRTGSGLGLAIARGIVEAHGGRMWLESQVGRGSAFLFTLPAIGAVA
jgi:PAS domain S-box-containing protein